MSTTTLIEPTPANREVIRSVATGRPDAYMIPLGIVRIRPGFNDARKADPDYPAHIRELADSLKANGWMRHKPLVGVIGADGHAYPSDGHSRYEAAILANSEGAAIENIPFMPEQKGTNEEDRIYGLILNNNGKRLTPLGEALVIKQLVGRGIDEKEIARRLGFAPQKVAARLTLIAAPSAIRDMVSTGELSATTAVKTIKQQGAKAVETLEAGKAAAKAAGKAKVMPKHLDQKPERAITDTTRLEWLACHVAFVEPLEGRFVVQGGTDGETLGEGETMRGAIDAAMSKTNVEG